MNGFGRTLQAMALIFFVSGTAASAQSISVGVIGGAPFTDVVSRNNELFQRALSPNYTLGPSLEVNLPFSLRVELDALYRPYEFTFSKLNTNISARQFRFPVLVQYRFRFPIVTPFVEAGPSFDTLASLSAAAKNVTTGIDLAHQSNVSVVLGGGADVKIPLLHVSGELRYTRQTVSNFANISNQNQAEVLVGLHF